LYYHLVEYERGLSLDNIEVAPRVTKRHPDLTDDDVRNAWDNTIRWSVRPQKDDEYIAVGFDSSGRLIEMVALRTAIDTWVVYHEQTPPTKRTLLELGLTNDRSKDR